ncbi:MAG: dienelactone hydrolase family protein [Anaerolineaceae bacterium]|jgi:carboxymethylenebutenolidase
MDTKFQGMLSYEGEEGQVQAFLSRPDTDQPRPAVIVIHEIFGLVDHTKDVANRFAQQGYVAMAPHLFSRPSLASVLTPANIGEAMRFNFSLPRERMSDAAFVQQELEKLPGGSRETLRQVRALMFGGGLPRESLVKDLVRARHYLASQNFVQADKIASVGFCFGGGMSINLACLVPLAACVVFYGDNPNPVDLVQNIAGPVLGIYGAEDQRINSHLDELVKSMAQYKKDFEMRIYPGAAHAFFNDTNPNTYRKKPARQAWEQVLHFYRRTLLEP